jgi:peptidoglycan/xylan/chitin deacetylase (PgdA/CDA1 family)
MDSYWDQIKSKISNEQISFLRPLQIDEIKCFDPNLIDFGAHSHSHCILRNEDRGRRDEEINLSIKNVEKWTGQKVQLFSYPNGRQNDFDDKDKALLKSLGIKYATTTISGKSYANTDPWELRRFPVGIHHDYYSFVSEVTGMRTLIKSFLPNDEN